MYIILLDVKGSLLLITELDIDITKASVYIQLDKVLHILEFYNKLRDQGEYKILFLIIIIIIF